MRRYSRAFLIVATLAASWLGMQAVHELGHVFGAVASGAEVKQVKLHPLSISETVIGANPQPLVVVWAGPILGCVLPIAVWLIAAAMGLPEAFLLRFFAGFCLIANGLYIGLGSFERIGDCGVMLQHGSQIWNLWVFGLLTVPPGFCLWHGQGRHFGLGPNPQQVEPRAVYSAGVVMVALLTLGLCLNS